MNSCISILESNVRPSNWQLKQVLLCCLPTVSSDSFNIILHFSLPEWPSMLIFHCMALRRKKPQMERATGCPLRISRNHSLTVKVKNWLHPRWQHTQDDGIKHWNFKRGLLWIQSELLRANFKHFLHIKSLQASILLWCSWLAGKDCSHIAKLPVLRDVTGLLLDILYTSPPCAKVTIWRPCGLLVTFHCHSWNNRHEICPNNKGRLVCK